MNWSASSGRFRSVASTSALRIASSTLSPSARAVAVRSPPKSAISPKTSPSRTMSRVSLRPSAAWTLISISPRCTA